MRKALIIGINDYHNQRMNLTGCVNDANELASLLEFNDNGERNFNIKKLTNEDATLKNVKENIKVVFDDNTDVGLFYFSGHGFDDELDGKIVLSDYTDSDYGLSFEELIKIISAQKAKNKIVILDCCYGGKAGNFQLIGDKTVIGEGMTILTACKAKECASEINGKGVFTNLLIEAIKGGASDILGNVTPGSVYAFVDRALGAFEQRPVFKTNVSRFVSLRKCAPVFTDKEIRQIKDYFPEPDFKYQLDPSYEPTNYECSKEGPTMEPFCTEEHKAIFAFLQKLNRNRLVIPSVEQHMYFAAMKSSTCELTALGKHYHYLVEKEII